MIDSPVTPDEFRRRLLAFSGKSGSCFFPRRHRDRQIVLKAVSLGVEADQRFDQKGIDSRLRRWLLEVGRGIEMDHVQLRRVLVEEGYLERTLDGSAYWKGEGRFHTVPFDPSVDEIDVWKVARAE